MTKKLVKTYQLLLALGLSPALMANPLFDETALDDIGMFYDEPAMEIPVVLTAARLRQSQLDTPASVTVIEADTIAALGFKDLEEIFRLVPGMLVGYHSGFGEKSPSVSYHGTQAAEHRRLQVLIDGRSVYKPALAQVEWANIPLALEDIKRIEVIRGPSSATYGANAYLGTINILTKHPGVKKGMVAKVRAGNRQVADSYVSVSGQVGETDIHFSVGSKHKSGFDHLKNGEDKNRDSVDSVFSQVRTYSQLDAQSSIEWQSGFKTGTNQQKHSDDESVIYNTEEDIVAQDLYIWSKYNYEYSSSQFSHLQVYSQNFKRTQQFNACQLAPGNILCGDINKDINEVKSEIEYQHTSSWSEHLRTVAGIRVRVDEFDSQTYNQGHSNNTNTSAFTNIEYKFAGDYILNMGGMLEADDLNGQHFSPRLALNYHLTPNQTLRFIYSRAIRSPSLYEKEGQLSLILTNATLNNIPIPDYELTEMKSGHSELVNEKITSHEISYFGLLPGINGQLDLKFFYDDLSGLISQGLKFDEPLTNENRITQKGFEGQLTCNLNTKSKLMFSFSRLHTNDDFSGNNEEVSKEENLSADHSGSLVWLTRVNKNTNFAAAYYLVDNWGRHEDIQGVNFSRIDLNVSQTLALNHSYQVKWQAAMQYRLDDDPLLYSNNRYSDDLHLYASVELNF